MMSRTLRLESARVRTRLATPYATFAVASLVATFVAMALRLAWDPPIRTYIEYVPIGAVFAVLVWDRLFPTWSDGLRAVSCDALVVSLALMRVFIPPAPFVSGHTLLATYAALTARRLAPRIIALVVLAETVYTKLFASGGWASMAGGLLVAGIIAAIHVRFRQPE